MIFAKLDVRFWRDKKFLRAGIAASGYWAATRTWLRDEAIEDAVLPFDMVGAPLGAGAREGTKLAEKLLEVGLFARRETGYELLGYAPRNATRTAIEKERGSTHTSTSDGPIAVAPESGAALTWEQEVEAARIAERAARVRMGLPVSGDGDR